MAYTVFVLTIILMLIGIGKCNDNFGSSQQIDPRSDHNKEHLKEDLDGVINKKPEDMSVEELQFHYFRQHDYDGDNMLDGNELMMSLIHHSKDSSTGSVPSQTDEQIAQIVDDVLKFQDKNNDGKITYQEYIAPFDGNSD